MQTPSGGFLVAYGTEAISVTLDNMLKVDMTSIHNAIWENMTLPDHVRGRGSASLAWVPVSDQGLLLAIGGVMNPVDIRYTTNASLDNESNAVSPGFMQTISVYDIRNDIWYNQDTSGDLPPQLADFCAVVAHQPDAHSYQIYIQGGYNGVDLNKDLNLDVYILSVPSFHWTKVTPLNQAGARWGHICITPYPDQMFVVGGQGNYKDIRFPRGRSLEVLNLNKLVWQDKYTPGEWSKYEIPPQVTAAGDPSKPAGNMNSSLAALFTQDYQREIVNWYPYTAIRAGSKSILGPVLGGVLGGVTLVAAAFGFWLWRRRQQRKRNRQSKASAATSETLQGSGDHLNGWFRDQAKQSVSAVAMEMDTSDQSTVVSGRGRVQSDGEIAELGGRSIFMPRSSMQTNTPLSPETLPEVSGESKKIGELPDSSTQHDSNSSQGETDYRPKNHPNYPRAYNTGASAPEFSTGQSTVGGMSSVGAEESSFQERLSFQGFPFSESRRDNYDNVYLGGAALPTNEPVDTAPRQRRIDAYFPSTERTNFDPLPSPLKSQPDGDDAYGKARPSNAPRQESNASSDFVITPLAMSDSAQKAASDVGMASAALATSPLSPLRPTHRRHGSSMSSGGQIIAGNNSTLPYQGPEEDHRQSAFIENLPDTPPRTFSTKRKDSKPYSPPTPVDEESQTKQPDT